MTDKVVREWIDSYHFGKLNRRKLLKRAASAGITASTVAAMAKTGGLVTEAYAYPSFAQDGDAKLVTVSDEQQQTWSPQFNPMIQGTRTFTANSIFEPMARYNTATGELVPWLATEWAWSDDNLALTFTIRDGVLWSDGSAFSAEDVKFTFDLYKQHDGLSNGGARVVNEILSSVEIGADGTTVTFTFSEVNTLALYDVADQQIVPKHIWETIADPVTEVNAMPVGTGPYANLTRMENQVWELGQNANYWQKENLKVDGLRFPAFADNDAVILALLNGDLDWAGSFVPDIEETYVAKDPDNFNYWFPATGATVHLYLNTTVAPFDNVDVRKAISMAINREQICAIAMFDYTHPADSTGLSDAYTTWKDSELAAAPWVTYNVDEANAMLDAAGLAKDGDFRKTADGTTLSFELNVVTGWSDWVQSCDIMAQNLGEIGIEVTVRPYDFSAWLEKVNNGDFTMSIGWSSGGPTPYNFYRGIMSTTTWNEIGTASNENWHRFKSEEADAALATLATSSVMEEQVEASKVLQQIYSDNAPAVPLFPGPQWGEFNTQRFEGFPSEEDPYAILSTYGAERLIVLNTIQPKAAE